MKGNDMRRRQHVYKCIAYVALILRKQEKKEGKRIEINSNKQS